MVWGEIRGKEGPEKTSAWTVDSAREKIGLLVLLGPVKKMGMRGNAWSAKAKKS